MSKNEINLSPEAQDVFRKNRLFWKPISGRIMLYQSVNTPYGVKSRSIGWWFPGRVPDSMVCRFICDVFQTANAGPRH